MEQPLVSIVVVSYNHRKYLQQVLDSVKAQTYSNWELIVADDASNDDSVEIFRNWLQKNNISAKEIYHPKNTGLATILNEAVELCNGLYLKFISADDYLHPDCLEKSVNFLEKEGGEYGMVFTDTFCVDENSCPLPDMANYDILGNIPAQKFREALIKGNRIAALTVLMLTKALKETGKYNSKFIVEDYYRWLKISEKYFIGYISEKLSYYRLHSQNISKIKEERIRFETIMLQIMFDHKGEVRDKINYFLQDYYLVKKKIPRDLVALYQNYPFRIKRLSFSIKNHVPPFIFRIISKLI